MFGFGMSAVDKAILNATEQMLAGYAAAGISVKSIARKIFDEAKAEALHDGRFDGRHAWRNIYRYDLGDILIKNPIYFSPRKAEGLTEEDIREYWNRPNILVTIGVKVNFFTKFVTLDIARQQGKELVQFARDKRRRSPIYGEPALWDQALPVNEGFSREDADLYLEFIARVGLWQERTAAAEQESLLAQYTSFNAMIRDLVRRGKFS